MSSQFICGSEKRRLLISGQDVINGIDYLEVIDTAAPPTYPAQRTLAVKLFLDVPDELAAEHVTITGGVRVANIAIEWATPLDDLVLTPAENAYFASRFPTPADRARVLVVRTDAYGDFSTYTLAIGGVAAFDPRLSRVEFSFKVECPQTFDCKPADDCPPAAQVAPAIDYLAKDYASFRRVMLDRLSVLSPQWTERNPADTGMVVTELLAYAADRLSYYQDAVATESYLGTARRRVSVRRHARMLDYVMHEGANARAFVCVEVDPLVGPGGVVLPRIGPDGSRTMFMTATEGAVRLPPDPTALGMLLASYKPRVFEPMHDALLFASHNEIKFYTWFDDDCCLPRGATRATLQDDAAARLCLIAGDLLVLEEVKGRDPGGDLGADPGRRQCVRLTRVTPSATRALDLPDQPRVPGPLTTDPLTGQAIVEIEWHAEDALTSPFCISNAIASDISVAHGNVVLADDGRTIVEPLSPAIVDDPERYRPQLGKPHVTHAVPAPDPTSPVRSAVVTIAQDPHAAVPSVSLATATDEWSAVPDLLRSDRFAREVVVEMDEGSVATLRFGDGVLGREPESNLTATYRIGRGLGGNVGAEAIAQVMTSTTSITRVRNPLPATGGAEPESIDEVKQYAPQAFRVQERAVTEADYAVCAMRHPEVRRAVATRRWTGSWYTVFLSVERAYGRSIDDAFRAELTDFIEQRRLAGEDLEVDAPIYVPLVLRLVVCCDPGYFRDEVERALREAFSAGRRRDGTPGFFAAERHTFGQPVYLSQVVAAAMRVPGVTWVDPRDAAFVFRRANDAPAGEVDRGYISMGRLEIARCESSPTAPENGRVDFVLMGGQ